MIITPDIMLEVCTDSVAGALTAQSSGACRIELCAGLPEGGTTPSPAQIRKVRELLHIGLHVLIRPRGGDFLYDDAEFEIMQSDIRFCGESGCDGIAVGMLRPDGTVDKQRCGELIRTAHQYSMSVTFHRAFDRSADLPCAMEDVIEMGCRRILTSGGCNTAMEGAEIIRRLAEQAGNRIIIMPGAGITPENAKELIAKTGLKEMHGTFRSYCPGAMRYRNTQLAGQAAEYGLSTADAKKIKTIINLHVS
ncbi:MAG: copper homeostasis protein CutC [Bacteroidales bacterium]|jgi:copper homeostasis protein|nr:copper homeostasis protein CutC [Bacteroidales bacterium]